jgi:hypothetical protein
MKLVILEGPDNIGKSTQAKIISQLLCARLISQLSKSNKVSFIRNIVKQDKLLNAFERQLLAAISHTVDAFMEFDGKSNIVMDRSYISSFVYGELGGLSVSQINILYQIYHSIYYENIRNKYDVNVIFLDADNPLDEPDNDIFESAGWDKISKKYHKIYNWCNKSDITLFSLNEHINVLDVTNLSIDQVTLEILKIISNGKR